MKVYIKVVAYDESQGLKATRDGTVEVPRSTVKLHEAMFGGDPADMLRVIGDSVYASAVGSVQMPESGSSTRSALAEAKTGAPVGAGHGAGKQDPLAAMLGLDLIDEMDRKESSRHGGGRGGTPPPSRR